MSPEHPPPTTFTRRPASGSPFWATRVWILRAAWSVIPMALALATQSLSAGLSHLRLGRLLPALLPVRDRRLDAVLGEHRAVDLDGRQGELLHDLRVLDLHDLVDRLALHELGHVARARDGAPAAERLEARILHDAVVADLELELHHVPALGCAHDASPDVRIVLGERPDVARVRVVVDHLVAVCHPVLPETAAVYSRCHATDLRSIPSFAISYSGERSRSRWTSCTTRAAT